MSEIDDSALEKTGKRFRVAAAINYAYILYFILTIIGQSLHPG